MIATLSGVVTEKSDSMLVIETAGVGYGVLVSRSDFESASLDKDIRVYIHEVVREDAYDLYGFSEWLGKELFEKLLSVSGVGPKAALAILSIGSLDHIHSAIGTGDIAFLQTASGVGKRTAERIAMELKNQVVSSTYHETGTQKEDAALQGLEALGYSRHDAVRALAKVPSDLDDSQRIKQALKEI